MIGPDDIEGMADEDVKAAYEAARRGAKGLPADCLYDGTKGARRLWRGIIKLGVIIADQEAELDAYREAERRRGADAMGVYPDDRKSGQG